MSMGTQQQWQEYVKSECAVLAPILSKHGFILDTEQTHTKGERFLMQAMTTTGGKKLILLGKNAETNQSVVIKATREKAGAQEIQHERLCRQKLNSFAFAYGAFTAPAEISFITEAGFTISIQEYITQEKTFLERPLLEQFTFALESFTAQATVHATTYKHFSAISHTFGYKNSEDYIQLFKESKQTANTNNVAETLTRALHQLQTNQADIERYCGFLTHTDFVPHNFRISGDTLYLLDFSSIRFGNKHEGWARFLNFMTLYNRELEAALLQYVDENYAPEERRSLQLMRLYRLGEIIAYYTKKLPYCEGNLLSLNEARITFWSDVLTHELENKRVPKNTVSAYCTLRDALRSSEEKERQQNLH